MDTSTERKDWRTVLREQGRTLRWLAIQTGRPPRTVYAYSQGRLRPTEVWLASVSRVLGEDLDPDGMVGSGHGDAA